MDETASLLQHDPIPGLRLDQVASCSHIRDDEWHCRLLAYDWRGLFEFNQRVICRAVASRCALRGRTLIRSPLD